jgi:hypothetical protein
MRFGRIRWDDDLPRLYAAGLATKRYDRAAASAMRLEPDPRIAHLGRSHEIVEGHAERGG